MVRPSNTLRPSPLREHLALDSRDLDEVVSAASAAQHPLEAELERRHAAIRFRLHHVPTGSLGLTHAALDYAGRYLVSAPPLVAHYYLQIPLQGRGFVQHGRSRVQVAPDEHGLLVSPGRPTRWEGNGGFREITVGIDADALMSRWRVLTGVGSPRLLRFDPAVSLRAPSGVFLARRVYALASGLRADHADLEAEVLDALLLGCPHDQAGVFAHRIPDVGEALVRRAEAYMEAYAFRSLTIAEVAREQEVSIRTLQRAFRRTRCVGPRRFLQDLRFSRVRTRLLQAREGESVTQLALEAGFAHLGLFAVEYRKRFGESPSATLRRAHGPRGRGAPRRTGRVAAGTGHSLRRG